MANNTNRNQKPFVRQVANAALRGASSGGGLVGSVAGAVRTGINTTQNIRSGFQTYKNNQTAPVKKNNVQKPKASKPISVAPKKPIAPSKPVAPKKPMARKK